MNWRKHSDYASVSDCGAYSVAKYGRPPHDYVAWRTPMHPTGRAFLSLHFSPDAAKGACEADARP